MKITHISLIGIVTDNWTYQDNLLPKYHKIIGHDVSMITSKYIYDNNGKIILDKRDTYINEDGVKIIRLNTKGNMPFNYRLKKFPNLYSIIENESPDILFVHGCQFVDINAIVKYAKLHKDVKVYVDNHADFTNSATNWLSRNVLHKIIWKHYAHKIEPYTVKFYGVLPSRVDFLKNIYKIKANKIDLLVMGADDEKVKEARNEDNKQFIREKYNISKNDFLIITGGKIDKSKKQTLKLMEAVKKIDKNNVKLIVFGSVTDDLKDEINKLSDGIKIIYIGWVNPNDSYKYFAASDLVAFPGRHSVYWEQVSGLGIPMIVKYWKGTNHVDLGGNCKFIYNDNIDEIYKLLNSLINNKSEIDTMKRIAEMKGIKYFSYKNIAKRSICE